MGVLKKLFDPIIITKCNQIGIWHVGGDFGMDNCIFECKQVAFTIWYVFALWGLQEGAGLHLTTGSRRTSKLGRCCQ